MSDNLEFYLKNCFITLYNNNSSTTRSSIMLSTTQILPTILLKYFFLHKESLNINFYAPQDLWNNKQTFTYDMDMKQSIHLHINV